MEERKKRKPFNIRLDPLIHEELHRMCEESGQSLTTAVERALTAYIKEYDEEQRLLKEIRGKS